MKFNMLTVLDEGIGDNRFGQALWLCRCDCGVPTLPIASYVRTGRTKSCGCLKVSNRRTHGHSRVGNRSRAYRVWCNMKARCDAPSASQYCDYGGRGITYDRRWASFENFLADMGEPPDGHSIDRINVNGNYERSNCQWATLSMQRRNKRPESKGGRLVWCEINGERLILTDAVKKYGAVPYGTVVNRIRQGWSHDRAVLMPYTRGFSHAPTTTGVRYEFNGKNLTLTQWSEETGIRRLTLLKRIESGLSIEAALTTPVGKGNFAAPQTGKRYEFNGKSLTLREWAQETGVPKATLKKRIEDGWSVERAMTMPIGKRHSQIKATIQ